jgi:hypothetical protein
VAAKVQLLANTVRNTALPNIYHAINAYCDKEEIVFIVDGDDELIGRQVFKLFNAIYQKGNLSSVYTNYITNTYSDYNSFIGMSRSYSA